MKEYGELEWARLSEKQRQQMLVRQKLKERKLRREGKFDEIEAMLAGVKETEEGFDSFASKSLFTCTPIDFFLNVRGHFRTKTKTGRIKG